MTILNLWNITARQLTDIVDDNPSLRGMMLGCVAEHQFRQLIEKHPQASGPARQGDDSRFHRSDRTIVYKGKEFSVEIKTPLQNSIREIDGIFAGRVQVDAPHRREVTLRRGQTLKTKHLPFGQFDILAVNCFVFNNRWNFTFALNRDLPKCRFRDYTKEQCDQLIATLVRVTWPPEPPFASDPYALMERLYRERK